MIFREKRQAGKVLFKGKNEAGRKSSSIRGSASDKAKTDIVAAEGLIEETS